MNDNLSSVHALAVVITRALDEHLEHHPGVGAIEICAALGAAGAIVMSKGYAPGFPEADLTGLGILGHGYSECLEVLRREQGN